jgi:hypothetical protein
MLAAALGLGFIQPLTEMSTSDSEEQSVVSA